MGGPSKIQGPATCSTARAADEPHGAAAVKRGKSNIGTANIQYTPTSDLKRDCADTGSSSAAPNKIGWRAKQLVTVVQDKGCNIKNKVQQIARNPAVRKPAWAFLPRADKKPAGQRAKINQSGTVAAPSSGVATRSSEVAARNPKLIIDMPLNAMDSPLREIHLEVGHANKVSSAKVEMPPKLVKDLNKSDYRIDDLLGQFTRANPPKGERLVHYLLRLVNEMKHAFNNYDDRYFRLYGDTWPERREGMRSDLHREFSHLREVGLLKSAPDKEINSIIKDIDSLVPPTPSIHRAGERPVASNGGRRHK